MAAGGSIILPPDQARIAYTYAIEADQLARQQAGEDLDALPDETAIDRTQARDGAYMRSHQDGTIHRVIAYRARGGLRALAAWRILREPGIYYDPPPHPHPHPQLTLAPALADAPARHTRSGADDPAEDPERDSQLASLGLLVLYPTAALAHRCGRAADRQWLWSALRRHAAHEPQTPPGYLEQFALRTATVAPHTSGWLRVQGPWPSSADAEQTGGVLWLPPDTPVPAMGSNVYLLVRDLSPAPPLPSPAPAAAAAAARLEREEIPVMPAMDAWGDTYRRDDGFWYFRLDNGPVLPFPENTTLDRMLAAGRLPWRYDAPHELSSS